MSFRRAVAVLLVLFACVGCGGEPEAREMPSEPTDTPSGDVARVETASAGGEARPEAAEPAPERLTHGPTTSAEDLDDARDESNLDRVLGVAAKAAEDAPRGRDLCETALLGLRAMLAAVERETGNRAPPPEGGAFLEACQAMPREVQPCLVPRYAFDHQAECERLIASAPDDARQRLEAVVQGRSGD